MATNNWKYTVILSVRIKGKKLTRKKRINILDQPKKKEKRESDSRREIQLDLNKSYH